MFLGIDRPLKRFEGKVIALLHRLDDNDDKLVIAVEDQVYHRGN